MSDVEPWEDASAHDPWEEHTAAPKDNTTFLSQLYAGLTESPGALGTMAVRVLPGNMHDVLNLAGDVGLAPEHSGDIADQRFIRDSGRVARSALLGSPEFAGEAYDVAPPQTFLEKLGRGLGQAGPALAVGPEGLGPNLARGALSVAGSTAAQEAVPDKYKPLAGVLGGLAGGNPEILATPFSAAKNALLRPDANAPARMADFKLSDIPPPGASAVLRNKNAAYLESALSHMPGGASVYQAALDKTLSGLQDKLEGATQVISGRPAGTPEQTGLLIQKGIQGASERMKARQAQLYDDALENVIGTPLKKRPLPAMEELSKEFTQELGQAPESRARTVGTALGRVNAILRDASNGEATLQTLRNIRTEIGRDLDDPLLAGVSGSQQPYLRRLYGALSSDINDVALKADTTGTVRNNLAKADRYTRLNSKRLDFLGDFLGSKRADQVYASALSSAKGGGATLNAIRKSLKPEEWDQVAGTVLGRMGLAKPGAQAASGISTEGEVFSPATFMTNWSSMSPEAKQALFGGTRYAQLAPKLERLVRVADHVKDFQKTKGGSPTFERGASAGLFGTMAALGTESLTRGDLVGAIGHPAAAFFVGHTMPKMAAKYMTNPKVIDALSNRLAAKTPSAQMRADKTLRSMLIGAASAENEDEENQ